jgi:GR25 family glycosyltransferase involved in LPS biosynthesis
MIITDILVINLDRRYERWSGFLDQTQNSSLINKFHKRISAIDGKDLTNNDFIQYVRVEGYNDIISSKQTKGLYLSRGAIGLAMTYYRICENCIRSTILLEDDIIISKQFDKVFAQAFMELPEDWDILYLGWCQSSNLKIIPITEHISSISGQVNGTHGWMINPLSAKKILNIFPLRYQIDTEIYLNKNLKKYSTTIPIVSQSKIYAHSDIQI